jgi:hypothetical protein
MDTWNGAARSDEFLWSVYGQNAFEAMVDICQSLLLIPRYYYDVTNSRHKLELLCRGRSYSVSTFEDPFESRYIREAYVPLRAFSSSRIVVGGTQADKRYMLEGVTGTGTIPPNDLPSLMIDATFIVRQTEENWDGTSGSGNFAVFLYTDDSRVDECHWYNYQTAAFVDEDFLYVKYYYNRWGFSKHSYMRKYSTIESTYGGATGFATNYPMRTTSISDGVQARSFYAVKVGMNVFDDSSTIVWHEV